MQETQVRSLGQEDPLEKEMATHSSILASWVVEVSQLMFITMKMLVFTCCLTSLKAAHSVQGQSQGGEDPQMPPSRHLELL